MQERDELHHEQKEFYANFESDKSQDALKFKLHTFILMLTWERGDRGGLGEAKVINIHIGTMQEIKGVVMDQLKSKGQDAVETMLRVINNISQSQSSVQ